MQRIIASLLTSLAAAGCAGIDVSRVTQADAKGLRFWRPAPYLVLTATDKGCAAKIVYLPNGDEEYALTIRPGIGVVSLKPTLEQGWLLTGLDASVDTTKAVELFQAFTAAAGLTPSEASSAGVKRDLLRPGLYRLKFEKGGLVVDPSAVVVAGDECRKLVDGGPAPSSSDEKKKP
jgi:hypothetical protein